MLLSILCVLNYMGLLGPNPQSSDLTHNFEELYERNPYDYIDTCRHVCVHDEPQLPQTPSLLSKCRKTL